MPRLINQLKIVGTAGNHWRPTEIPKVPQMPRFPAIWQIPIHRLWFR